MTSEEVKTAVESLIDSTCADTVKDAFADVCREKADHIRTNWQDETSAAVWESLAKKLDSVPNLGV